MRLAGQGSVPRPLRPSLGSGGFSPGTLPAAPAGAIPPLQACAPSRLRYGFRSRGTQDCFAPSGRLAGTCGLINHHTRKGPETK